MKNKLNKGTYGYLDRLKAYEQQGAEWIEKLPARTRRGYKLFEICPAIYGKLLSRMQEAG